MTKLTKLNTIVDPKSNGIAQKAEEMCKTSPGASWHNPERMLVQTLSEQKHTKAYKSTRAHYMKTHTGPTPYV